MREVNRARAFVDLAGDIESAVERGETVERGEIVIKLSTLHTFFEQRLEEFGHSIAVNKTRLKEELLEHFCNYGLQEQPNHKHYVLVLLATNGGATPRSLEMVCGLSTRCHDPTCSAAVMRFGSCH